MDSNEHRAQAAEYGRRLYEAERKREKESMAEMELGDCNDCLAKILCVPYVATFGRYPLCGVIFYAMGLVATGICYGLSYHLDYFNSRNTTASVQKKDKSKDFLDTYLRVLTIIVAVLLCISLLHVAYDKYENEGKTFQRNTL